jgi:predicted ATP-dependent endonuclease of OLD family
MLGSLSFIHGISFLGPQKKAARLDFAPGLNVIAGASETGKSFIVESIDFLLGSGRGLRDFRATGGDITMQDSPSGLWGSNFELQRETGGGHFAMV